MRRSLRAKRDEEAFQKSQNELKNLKEQARKGEIDLYFADECAFSLTPCVPYAWQKQTVELPSSRSKRINVLGFLNPEGILRGYRFESSLNGELFLEALHRFAQTLTRKTIVVLDNSPVHACKQVQNGMETLKKEYPIEFYFIPPYSPELNLIEILWKKIKYEWLEIAAYENLETLLKALEYLFANYENKYQITFE